MDIALPPPATALQVPGVIPDMAFPAIPEDERVWVPERDRVWYRPLMFDTVGGGWTILLRVRRAGVYSRHRHPGPVHGYTIKGRWRYLEHEWVAQAGTYIFEPPGAVHTLVVDNDDEMIGFFFNVCGITVFVDEQGNTTGHEDTFTRIRMAREHYARVGLGAEFVDQFIR